MTNIHLNLIEAGGEKLPVSDSMEKLFFMFNICKIIKSDI